MGRAAPDARDVGAQRLRAALRSKLLEVDDRVLIGRYELGPRLGAGGMGVVYRGWDPKLQRAVAIKLMPLGDDASQDVLREARAMASVSHRHVVPVYDVGRREREAYVVMSLMKDGTLTQWIDSQARAPAVIVDKVIEAGLGLAAAHRAGVVHHDFKPSNVLLSPEGQACVSDFGLSSIAAPVQSLVTVGDHGDADASVRGGTVGYCAPERVDGHPGDARSDQYSFCVTLAVLLAESVAKQPAPEAASEIVAALVGAPPAGLPARVGRALRRGLCSDPADRFESMDALLAALRPRARSPRRWIGVGAALGTVATGAAVAMGGGSTPPVAAVSPPEIEAVGAATDAGAQDQAMLAALRAAKLARFGDALDQAQALARLAWSLGASDDRNLAELEMELGLIAQERSAHDEANRRLRDALAHAQEARWDEGIVAIRSAMIKALENSPELHRSALGHERFARAALSRITREVPKLRFSLDLAMTSVELTAGNLDRADRLAQAAADIGARHGLRERYWAIFDQCRIAQERRRYEEGQALCQAALEAAESVRASMRDQLLVRGNLAGLATLRGDVVQARVQSEAMLPLFVSHYGATNERTVEARFNLAMLRDGAGDAEGACALYEGTIEILQRWHPDNHVMLAKTYGGLGQAKAMLGALAEAETWYSKALVELDSAGQGDDPSNVQWRAQLGGIEMERGRTDAALGHLDAAVDAAGRIGEPARVGLATALAYRGKIRFERGELDAARADLRASIDVGRGSFEAPHPDQAWEARVLAQVEEAQGNYGGAFEIMQRVVLSLDNAGLHQGVSRAQSAFQLARLTHHETPGAPQATELAKQARDTLALVPEASEEVAEIDAWIATH